MLPTSACSVTPLAAPSHWQPSNSWCNRVTRTVVDGSAVPLVDVTDTNPNIAYVHDPYLPPLGTGAQNIGKVWAGGLSETNPLVSPLYGSLKGLPPTYVYAGSLDSVSPDALVLQQEAVSQAAPISFVLATGEIHDWVFLTPDGVRYWPQIHQELGA